MEKTTVIKCYFDPTWYITDRRRCVNRILEEFGDKVPDELRYEWYDMPNDAGVDEIETFISKLEKALGVTVLTIPETEAKDDP
jgi:hypothetical protein